MANRFNDRDRMNDRDREEHDSNFPRRDRDREHFRSEGQGRSQDWRESGRQEDWDWSEGGSGSQHRRGQGEGIGRRGSDIEGSRFTGGGGQQDRFGNQEMNRGFGRGDYNRGGYGQWEDQESSRWGIGQRESSRGFGSQFGNEYEGGFGQGRQSFGQGQSQGFGQGQFRGSYSQGQFGGQESWRGGQLGQQGQRFGTGIGRFAGKGPRGYRRSDERIQEDINERLTQDPDIDATEINVVVNGGEVVLSGSVDDREAKRRAEDLAEQVSGVKDVQNQIRVKGRQEGSESQFGTGSQSFGSGYTGMGIGSNEGNFTGQSSFGQGQTSTQESGKDKDKDKDKR